MSDEIVKVETPVPVEKRPVRKTNYFKTLYDIDVSSKVSDKNGLSYLSWASAWAEVKKKFPDATYCVYENPDGRFWFDDGKTGWVKTGVTINGIEAIERLPIMDHRNKAIEAENIKSTDANKAVQRSITKACGRHGLGLYLYEGEDLPEATNQFNDMNRANFELACNISKQSGELKTMVGDTVRKFIASGNPNHIKSIEESEALHNELEKLKRSVSK